MLPFSGLWLALPQLELCGYSRAHLETIRFTPIWSQLVISELMLFLCRYVQRCWKQPASIVSLLNFLPNTGSLCTESLNSLLLTMDQSGSSNAFISIVHTMDFFFRALLLLQETRGFSNCRCQQTGKLFQESGSSSVYKAGCLS